MKLDSLPKEFTPYKQLEIATNKLIDGVALVSVNGFIPVLIGKGETPEIWVTIPADQQGKEWRPIVSKNTSLLEVITVNTKGKVIGVAMGDDIVLEVKEITSESAEITQCNLRPFGINVFLEDDCLKVMTNRYSGNTITGAKIFIDVGKG
ncbi:hypothetical protein [Candidatus Nitrospira allomarina]|uniref:Uncharacterized protein n=1 Tax=Candidatus Nitrospira allomarina TaxID=3020900 RepID=A0AA96JSZ0_9BACT|nr:hypothetical protein [Candidatus Nitrospira allomarina]WNM58813.1 hypothetical protein PP769_03325 [Candidatus Nitrospira allomarina]